MCLSFCAYAVSSVEFQSFAVKPEADSNDVTEFSRDDKPSTGMFGFYGHSFSSAKWVVAVHALPPTHIGLTANIPV